MGQERERERQTDREREVEREGHHLKHAGGPVSQHGCRRPMLVLQPRACGCRLGDVEVKVGNRS